MEETHRDVAVKNINQAVDRVLTFGEPLVVCAHKGTERIAFDRDFRMDVAGAELNTAIALGRLSIPVAYAAAVGDDPFGEFLIRELKADSVDASRVIASPLGATGILFKMRSGMQSDSNVYYYRSATPMALGQWKADQCVNDVLEGTFSFVHTTGIVRMLCESTRQETDRVLQAASESGIRTSFDINVRLKMADAASWRNNLKEVIPFVTWLFIGDTEAKLLFGTDDEAKVYEEIVSFGFSGQGLIVKRGERGATAYTSDGSTHVEAKRVQHVVDTVGAGDGFNAGFIAGLLRGESLQTALTLGTILGAYAVTSAGDSSGYPSLSEVQRLIYGNEEVQR